jgi:hypothetical protein
LYEVYLSDEARDVVGHLVGDALKSFAELVDLLTLDPHAGLPYREPDSDLRTITIADGHLLVVWLVLDDQQRVELLRVVPL